MTRFIAVFALLRWSSLNPQSLRGLPVWKTRFKITVFVTPIATHRKSGASVILTPLQRTFYFYPLWNLSTFSYTVVPDFHADISKGRSFFLHPAFRRPFPLKTLCLFRTGNVFFFYFIANFPPSMFSPFLFHTS